MSLLPDSLVCEWDVYVESVKSDINGSGVGVQGHFLHGCNVLGELRIMARLKYSNKLCNLFIGTHTGLPGLQRDQKKKKMKEKIEENEDVQTFSFLFFL